ncbi:MAG: chemotaxis protein CheW [Gammaproteobacteria bacterium]|nr:chemotaxis protein CheW [Gammaproteobacteria bacterium]
MELTKPSEVLNREFVVPEDPVLPSNEPETAETPFRVVTTHAVKVGNLGLLLPADEISELVDSVQTCHLPNTPGWFDGMTSIRGNMVPMFDLHQLLEVDADSEQRKAVIHGSGDDAVGFWIDEMPRMVMVTSDDRLDSRPPLPSLVKRYAREYFLKDNQIWIEWDIKGFFAEAGNNM